MIRPKGFEQVMSVSFWLQAEHRDGANAVSVRRIRVEVGGVALTECEQSAAVRLNRLA